MSTKKKVTIRDIQINGEGKEAYFDFVLSNGETKRCAIDLDALRSFL